MIDLFRAQEDCYLALLSAGQFASVNIVNERRFQLRSDLEVDAIWSTVRNGKAGNGILCEELQVDSLYPNAPGPTFVITFPIVCFQNGDAALLPNVGGGFRAQNLALGVIDLFYQWSRDQLGIMLFEGRSYDKARDYNFIEAIRVTPKIKVAAGSISQRVAYIVPSNVGNQVTLTTTTPGATIVYTLDGSFPCNPNIAFDPLNLNAQGQPLPANPNATIYSGPFQVASGQLVRAIGYANGLNMGPERKFILS